MAEYETTRVALFDSNEIREIVTGIVTPETFGWEDSDMWRERTGVIICSRPSDIVLRHFTCVREMVRDYAKEAEHNDGFAYWRTTDRLIVTWYDGSITYILTRQVSHGTTVVDCGYDESAPF